MFNELFKKGFPYFWDDKGNLIAQEIYHALLVQQRNEDSKFNDLEKYFKGQVIVDKLIEDFDI